MKNSESMSERLNELLTKNYDAEEGYKKAAEIVENPQLKSFFKEQAQNRYEFGHELKEEIKNVGGSLERGKSITRDAHRAWMSIQDVLANTNEETVLKEVVRGEKAAIAEYANMIEEGNLPPTTKSIVTNQIVEIENALRSTKNMEVIFA